MPRQVEIAEETKPCKTEMLWIRFVFAAILTEYISPTMHSMVAGSIKGQNLKLEEQLKLEGIT